MKHIPNILTVLRILITPLFIFFIFSDIKYSKIFALLIFSLASLTDYFDGFFARKFNVVSEFGKFLDPIADKLLILSAFLSFLFLPILSSIISIWMVLIIFFRDIFITGLKVLLNSTGRKIQTSKFAKFKTAFQMITVYFILIYLLAHKYNSIDAIDSYNAAWFLYILMISTTLMTLISGLRYIIKNSDPLYYFFNNKQSSLDI